MAFTDISDGSQAALQERLAAAYASGVLTPALRLLVETQCELREDAAQAVAASEMIAGAFFEAQAPAAMGAGALADVFARIEAGHDGAEDARARSLRHAARRASGIMDEILHLPHAVHDAALMAIGQGGWTFAGPGLRTLALDLDGEEQAEIIRIEPGWGAPRHTHKGGEYTLVLAGAFSDDRGRYGVGDLAVAGPGLTHRPIAEHEGVCYCLAVTDAPLEFMGALGLLQKIWRH